MDRTILHCDMNSFYASVELLDHPELEGLPAAVCGDPESRHGIILAKNEEARRYGVKTAETIWQAKKKCPGLQFMAPHHEKYSDFSRRINGIYLRYTDQVEPFSIDESWLDVTASLSLFGTGKEIADEIRHTVKKELGLTLSAGVSFNKIFAKMGSDYRKPDATTVIDRDNFRDLLWPMDIGSMFFVGKTTADKLRKYGITTIGQLADTKEDVLSSILGKHGRDLHLYANGLDESPVARFDEREKMKSAGHGTTFRKNLTDMADISRAVLTLSDDVARRLRKGSAKAYGVKVDIKDPSFRTITRQQQLENPTNRAEKIAETAMAIIGRSWRKGSPVRMLTVTAINLCGENEARQLSLFEHEDIEAEKGEKVERTMDDIRSRFGSSSISFGGTMGKKKDGK